jgi:putative membrane protein
VNPDGIAYWSDSAWIVVPLNLAEASMEWNIIGMNFLYAVLGVVLMFVAYRVIDRLTPEVNFGEELRKGNMAVGIFVAAIFLAIAIIIGGALN